MIYFPGYLAIVQQDLYFYTIQATLDTTTGIVQLSEILSSSEIDVLKFDYVIAPNTGYLTSVLLFKNNSVYVQMLSLSNETLLNLVSIDFTQYNEQTNLT